MKITIGVLEVDPIFLLMHESDSPLGNPPLDEHVLEDMLNRALEDRCPADLQYLRFTPPSLTSRWGLAWRTWDGPDEVYWRASRGARTPAAVRAEMPHDVMVAIRALADSSLVWHPVK